VGVTHGSDDSIRVTCGTTNSFCNINIENCFQHVDRTHIMICFFHTQVESTIRRSTETERNLYGSGELFIEGDNR